MDCQAKIPCFSADRKKCFTGVTFQVRQRYIFDVNDYDGFYIKNKDRLFAYLLRMTGDYPLACDLVQESFTRYLGRYSNSGDSRPLLYTIARNAALDAIRRPKADGLDAEDQEDPGNDPEQQVMAHEAFERMLAAIGQLAPPDRELISLVATADLTYREIAGVLNMSEANVKVKVHRARTKLREILGSGGD
jgi:RNA polymerase sigma-70 factor (ECF subfamily)